jgi:hypothetical protein
MWLYFQHSSEPKKSDPAQGVAAPQAEKPDITIRLIYPDYPSIVLVNNSDKLAREIKWSVAVWNLDDPRTYVNPHPEPYAHDPLPFPVSMFDFLRPHSESGPQQVFGSQHVRPYVKEGQNVFGSISVICPDCTKGHTYVVYWTVGRTGWYAEIAGLGDKKFTEGELVIPHHFTKELIQAYVQEALAETPPSARIPIGPGAISSTITPPSVLLVPAADRLLLHNQNTYELSLWGDKFGNEPPAIDTQKRIIPVGAHYYFLNNILTAYAQRTIGANGEQLYPFDVFLETPGGKRYTAKFYLLIQMQNSSMTVHTQHLGVIEGGW